MLPATILALSARYQAFAVGRRRNRIQHAALGRLGHPGPSAEQQVGLPGITQQGPR